MCAASHMLHSYLLGVTLIIHAASHLPVTGYDSRFTVFSAIVHMSVSLLGLLGACVNSCVLPECSFVLFPGVYLVEKEKKKVVVTVSERVNGNSFLALYLSVTAMSCAFEVHISLPRPWLMMVHFVRSAGGC